MDVLKIAKNQNHTLWAKGQVMSGPHKANIHAGLKDTTGR